MAALEGKIAIVTGGSSGIGLAIARLFSQRGATSILVARGESSLKKAVDIISSEGGKAEYFTADVGNEEDVLRVTSQVMNGYQGIDILINNAGVGYRGPVDAMPVSQFDEMVRTNLRGTYLFSRSVLPFMKKRKKGHIVNISSGAGKNGIADYSGYCATKFGVMGLSEAMALEAKPFGVKISVVCPGSTNTRFHENLGEPPGPELGKSLIQPEEIAHIIYEIVTMPDTCWIYEASTRAFLKGQKT